MRKNSKTRRPARWLCTPVPVWMGGYEFDFFYLEIVGETPWCIFIYMKKGKKNCTKVKNHRLSSHDFRKGLETNLSLGKCRLSSSLRLDFHRLREGWIFWKIKSFLCFQSSQQATRKIFIKHICCSPLFLRVCII